MQLRRKEVVLGETERIVVCEAGWDYSFRFTENEKELEPLLADPASSETFKYFCRNYYSLMASCVVEGNTPTPQEAFALSRLHLDNWYFTVWELNEDIIGSPCPKATEHEEVEFRDGSSVTVWQSHGVPSFVLKLIEIEDYATKNPLEGDPAGQVFYSMFYPKLAASCNGSSNIPDGREVRNWPRGEIQKWLEASRRLNPDWFVITEKQQEETAQSKKKKVRKR
jgi:hypothetical protein